MKLKCLSESNQYDEFEDEFDSFDAVLNFVRTLNFRKIKPKWPKEMWDISYKGEFQSAAYHIYYCPKVAPGEGRSVRTPLDAARGTTRPLWLVGEPINEALGDSPEDRIPEGIQ